MELNWKNIKKILLLVFLSAIIVCGVFNMESVFAFLKSVYSLLSPITAAFCIAFIFNILLRALETKVFAFMDKSKLKFVIKARRPLCLALTYILALGIIALLVLVIIPDIIETSLYLVKKLPSFLVTAREWAVSVADNFNIPESKIPTLNLDFASLTKALQDIFSNYSNSIVNGAVDITSSVIGGVYDTVFSLVISVYILAQKERIGSFVNRTISAFVPQKAIKTIYHIAVHASEAFSKFIGGQLTESVILGTLCYIGMLIFRFPNAPIISILIGVTSLVPIVGAFTGIAIGFLLIIITSPIKAILFVIFILILQQIEGNLIYPRVVGKAVGLPGILVISAVLLGGNLGGILGALLGVPVSALLFTLLKEAIENRQKLKDE